MVVPFVSSVPLTLDLARWLNSLEPIPGERALSNTHLFHLRREFQTGRVTVFHWAYAKVREKGGQEYRLDGQHSSYLILRNGQIPAATVSLARYDCETLADAVEIWSKLDPSFSARKRDQVLDASVGSDPELSGLQKKLLRTVCGAVVLWKFGKHDNKLSHLDKAKALQSQRDFALWCGRVFSGGKAEEKRFTRVGIFFAALAMFLKEKGAAETFWRREVLHGTNPDPLSGSRALQLRLLEVGGDTGRAINTGRERYSWSQVAELCLSAWESWLTGRPVKNIRLSKVGLARFVPNCPGLLEE